MPSRFARPAPLVVLALALAVLPRHAGAAEEPKQQPIPRFALDLRGNFARFQALTVVSDATGAELPGHGLGFAVGAFVYPVRWKTLTIGLGGELVVSRGRHVPLGPPLETRFRSVAPQISFNFGGREGWSYISGGIGKSSFWVASGDAPFVNDSAARLKTINYGAGARWFWNAHLAFCLDLRIYAINPDRATTTPFSSPRMNQFVVSTGFSFH
jgi:hypothetical protein